MSSDSAQAPETPSPDWDPFKQNFTLLLPDGTPFNVTIPAVDAFAYYDVRICASFGSQLGASLTLFVVLAIITKSEKRRSPLFIINMLSLVFNILRCLLQILYFTGPWSEVYTFFSGDYSRIPASSYANSIAAEIVALLLLLAVEFSLVMQTYVVCATMRDIYRYMIAFGSAAIALMAIGFRFGLMVMDIRSILTASYPSWRWLASGSNIMTTISICFFCAVFVTKLGHAMLQRRKLGLKQFGPMQVVFIMGCQTLIVPAIFSILAYFVDFPGMASLTLTLVAMLVPLSSMWASASTAERSQSSGSQGYHRKLFSSYASGSVKSGGVSESTNMTHTRISHSTAAGPSSPGPNNEKSNPPPISEMDVLVDRTVSIRSDRE
ncbi:hypothetical protein GP486_004800 [Trichoglossum hirsutum]|uniref:Pheromone alpha factor receptor n=1 Tax=Trichoglossum hirsutum TaxID=265104 RepID=A0A9P8RP07_9PEZI|nr:hypothetical protein GP486_004800 [Trichoglossum hirsutum]